MAATVIPLDIIHTILLNLCVKSLLRFKTACKSWNTIISDPQFAKIHHQRSKNSYPQNLLICKRVSPKSELTLFKIENGELELNAILQPPHGKVLCMGDGLVLLGNISTYTEGSLYSLWNPSSRKHAFFWCTYTWANNYSSRYALCRDPSSDDYKVLIKSGTSYIVYSCKNRTWTTKQKCPYRTRMVSTAGLYVEGFAFWILEDEYYREKDIIYFDPRDDKFKKLEKPILLEGAMRLRLEGAMRFSLTSLRGCLCAYNNTIRGVSIILSMWTMKGHVDSCSWSRLRTIKITPGGDPLSSFVMPIFFSGMNEGVVRVVRTKHGIRTDFPIAPYVENLCFPIPDSTRPKRKRSSFLTLNGTDDDDEDEK